ncbi:hypothetical protein BG011_004026 [Mortierella polycephala]|uniref:Uncharacterized protein n=1 Tax=Mortierella polycephala TaxID=41804 RepID=A0A9P6Q1L5_9FUNG|nr:hypothetical protein BG011_004026 [Mortierella polycephala]
MTTDITQTNPVTVEDAADMLEEVRKVTDADKVSAAMGSYMLQGWAMLNDGCPDCNTPLMRNREATSQICVNCELNPPVDAEELDGSSSQKQGAEPESQSLSPPTSVIAPAPTSALPSVPVPSPGAGVPRAPSPQNHRASILDPMMEARRALRPVGNRLLGGSVPLPPSTPPPGLRPSAPLPQLPAKSSSGPLLPPKTSIPLPPGPPPSLPLSPPLPPPGVTLVPQSVPRDMRRSPQSSIVISGNILPPSTPPPPPPASAITSGPLPMPPNRPLPPLSTGVEAAANLEPVLRAVNSQELVPVTETEEQQTAIANGSTTVTEVVANPTMEDASGVGAIVQQELATIALQEPVQESVDGQEQAQEPVQESLDGQEQARKQDAEEEDDKGAESDDDFEDAEEEVYKPTEEEVKERESKREQSERASRLIGQKMLQGWAMLQDPCPNPACHGVPLLRNREKKEYCVVCENYFQREQDLEHGKYTIVPKGEDAVVNLEATPSSLATATSFPAVPTTLPPPPLAQIASPPIQPQQRSIHNLASPNIKATSPITSPSMGRSQNEFLGRVSGSIVLPPAGPMSPSLRMGSQQILGKHLGEDLDKLAAEDDEARKHIQIIRKVGEFSNKSLPPVPSVPSSHLSSRPVSTYSNSSEYHPSESEKNEMRSHRQIHSQRLIHANLPPPPPGSNHIQPPDSNTPTPAPLSPEVQALVAATHKTIATILVKLEAYRNALEVSENPKECQVLTNQIKGLMECLKACRETL